MLMAVVLLPESFSAIHFADPTYHLHMEVLLRGIDANGLILVDAEERLYRQICDYVEPLASIGKAKTTHALFEELLKRRRQKVVRFVKTNCSFSFDRPSADVATCVAVQCKADGFVVDPSSVSQIAENLAGSVLVIPATEYISSNIETERRRCYESLPSLDQMATGEFDQLIVAATRFSLWLRFYDKQIGKATSLSRFKRGIERILSLWINAAHFPKAQLSAELFTVVDESPYKQYEPSVAYHRVKGDLIDPLQTHFGIPIKSTFKRDCNLV